MLQHAIDVAARADVVVVAIGERTYAEAPVSAVQQPSDAFA